MNAELCLLSKIIQSRSLSEALEAGVDRHWFYDHEHIWNFITEYNTEFGGLPSFPTLTRKFPDATFLKVNEEFGYLVSEVQKAAVFQDLQGIKQDIHWHSEQDPMEVLERVRNLIYETTTRFAPSKSVDVIHDYKDRLEATKEQVGYFTQHRKPKVMACGIKDIDIEAPFLPGTLTTIFGDSGSMKSFSSTMLANKIRMINNKPVVMVSLEMDEIEVGYRVDVLTAAELKMRLSNRGMMFGHKGDNPLNLMEYENLLKEQAKQLAPFHVETGHGDSQGFSVASFAAVVDHYHRRYGDELGLVVLDYLGLMEDSTDWQDIKTITRRNKQISRRYNTAILQIAQARRGKRGELGDNNMVGGGYSLIQDSDTVYSIAKSKGVLVMKNTKNRRGDENWKMYFEVDPDYGQFVLRDEEFMAEKARSEISTERTKSEVHTIEDIGMKF